MASLAALSGDLIHHFGYGGVAVGLFVNALGIPIIPSELVLPLAGAAVNQGSLQPLPLLIIATIAQVAGLSLTYFIARSGGVELVERYGRYVLIRRRELEAAERAFAKYGGRLVLFGLCLPAIHGYVGYPAGLAKMKFDRFIVAATIGSAAWTVILASLGYFLGSHLGTIDLVLHQFGVLIALLVIALIVWWVRRQRRQVHDSTTNHAA